MRRHAAADQSAHPERIVALPKADVIATAAVKMGCFLDPLPPQRFHLIGIALAVRAVRDKFADLFVTRLGAPIGEVPNALPKFNDNIDCVHMDSPKLSGKTPGVDNQQLGLPTPVFARP